MEISHRLVLVIIQNLHKNRKQKAQKLQKKKVLLLFNSIVFFLLFSFQNTNAQDSIIPQEGIIEKTNIEFQERFFKALTEKAINNYQNAIENLEECNRLKPNNKAVLFELSKNYLSLKRIPEAIDFGEKALSLDTKNIWLLEHLIKVYKKNYNFKKAIFYQEKISIKYPNKKQVLVYLHLQNKDINSAKKVLKELEDSKMLNLKLRKIKQNLENKQAPKSVHKNTNDDLISLFQKEKSFKYLKPLLSYLYNKNDLELLKYSEEGLSLFPAQPFVYLMNGRALNNLKKYKKAIVSLQNGIDFVIDDAKTTENFYKEFVKAYKGLGDEKNIKKYKKKIKN